MINLEVPKKFGGLIAQSHEIARVVFRPNSRRYDREEHTYPKELDMLRAVIEGAEEGGGIGGAGATGVRSSDGATPASEGNRNGSNMASVLAITELWPTSSSSTVFTASGPRWRSPSPRQAPTRRQSVRPRASRTTSMC